MSKHECGCSFCGDKFEDEDKKAFKCPTCSNRRTMGTFPGDRYPTESKDVRRAFFHNFANTAIDLGAQRDELLAVAEAALRTYEDLEKGIKDGTVKLPYHLGGFVIGRKAYAVRALARIKRDWPNANI